MMVVYRCRISSILLPYSKGVSEVKKYLKLTGMILLYILIVVGIQLVVGLVFGVAYVIQLTIEHQVGDINAVQRGVTDFIVQNTYLIVLISNLLTFLAYWLIFSIRKLKIFAIFHSSRLKLKDGLVLMVGGLALNFLTMSFFELTSINNLFQEYDKLMEMVIGGNNFWGVLISVGIFGPICEEIFFRGIIFKEMKGKMPIAVAVIIQAGLFGLVHGNLLQGAYAFILGLILAWVYLRFNSIWAPILVHITYNTTSVLGSRIISDLFLQQYIVIITIISLVFTALFGLYIWHKEKATIDEHIASIED